MISHYILLFPAAMCLMFVVSAIEYVWFREPRLPAYRNFLPGLTIIVPAHNEELVIERTLKSLLRADYPGLRIVVVSDGSTDATVEICTRYESRGIVVCDLQPNRGKSGALQYVLESVDTPLMMVVDADTTVNCHALRLMVQQFTDSTVAAVTGNVRVRNTDRLLTRIQAMEYMAVISLIKRAQNAWGALLTVSGASVCLRTETLRAVGGWSNKSATEDIEVSWRLQKEGFRIRYEPRAMFFVQTPTTWRALFRQRCRWAQGLVEVLRLHGNIFTSHNSGIIPVALQAVGAILWTTLMPVYALGLLVSAAFTGGSPFPLSGSVGGGLFLVFSLFLVQVWSSSQFDGLYLRRTTRLIPFAILYPLYYWLVILPSFVAGTIKSFRTNTPQVWMRTPRVAAASNSGIKRMPHCHATRPSQTVPSLTGTKS